jgi:mannan endo-1,4-beta-mannosidase
MQRVYSVLKVVLLCTCLCLLPAKVLAAAPMPVEVNIFLPTVTTDFATLNQLEQNLDIRFTSVKWYLDWSDPFTPEIATRIRDHGAIPDVTWQPQINGQGIAYQDVLTGKYDSYLIGFARSAKQFGSPLRIALAPEMNTPWVSWGVGKNGNTPQNHQKFWRYVVTKFNEAGVTNVSWVWAPNIIGSATLSTYKELYPGDAYVTFTGLDGYNWGTAQQGSKWQSFKDVFLPSYTELTKVTSKKIIINETASSEEGGNKAEWIKQVFTDIPRYFPKVQGITWFNMNKETDWRIDSTATAKAAFIKAVKKPPILPPKVTITPREQTITQAPSVGSAEPNKNTSPSDINLLRVKAVWPSYAYGNLAKENAVPTSPKIPKKATHLLRNIHIFLPIF